MSSYGPSSAPRGAMSRRVLRGFNPTEFAALRLRRGLTVSEVARLADVAHSTVHAWEAGTRTPQVDFLVRVMALLDAPIDDVVTIEPEERYPGDWRVIRGLTQPQLAASAGIATNTLRGIERADQGLTDTNAATLAQVLDISVEQYRAAYQRARTRPPGTPA